MRLFLSGSVGAMVRRHRLAGLGVSAGVLVLALFLSGCGVLLDRSAASTPVIYLDSSPTPTPIIYADTFFSGCGAVDSNGNGERDETDRPMVGARFTVTFRNETGFGGLTGSNGCAFLTVPGGLDESSWPIVVEMVPPKDGDSEYLEPSAVTLTYPDYRAEFLFEELD